LMGCQSSTPAAGPPTVAQGRDAFTKKYTLSTTIGEGSFGQVRQAWDLRAKRMRAVKVLDLRCSVVQDNPERLVRAAKNELKIWQHIGRHEHCIGLLDSFFDEQICFLVMERCEGSLMEQHSELSRAGDAELSRIFREMLLGLSHLHDMKVVHRDVKPNNFLLGGPGGRSVKLCDFGLSTTLPKRGGLLAGCVGTAPYMSPEMVAETGHSLSTDIWSYAATLFVLVYRNFPYTPKDHSSLAAKQAVLVGVPEPRYKRMWSTKPFAPAVEELIKALLVRKAEDRPTAAQATLLPFLTQAAGSGRWLVRSGSGESSESRGACSSRNPSDDSTYCGERGSSLNGDISCESGVVTTDASRV